MAARHPEANQDVASCFSRAFRALVSLTEPLGAIRCRIAERRLAGHHFRDEPSGDGAQRQAGMAVATGEPQASLPGRAADHRTGIGKAGTRAHPWTLLDGIAEREQAGRRRHDALELYRRRRGIAGGEFGAGGEADALLHGRETVAVLGIEYGPRQAGIATRTEVG